ncbi:replication stress response regulator SDE2-like [Argonauta hians]
MAECCFLNIALPGAAKSQVYNPGSTSTVADVKLWLCTGAAALPQVLVEDCYLTCQGRVLNDNNVVMPGCHYQLVPRLVGGKGGFGSMLRAIGAQIEKTTNREACRDLSGRRMRDINNEKQLKEWMAKQVEREKEKARRREERAQRLREVPKHKFEDQVYQKQREKVSQDLDDAITAGLKRSGDASTSGESLRGAAAAAGGKKAKLESKPFHKDWNWIGINKDNLSDSDLSDDCDIATACPTIGRIPTASTSAGTSACSSTSMDDCTEDSNSSISSTKFMFPGPRQDDRSSSPECSNNSTTTTAITTDPETTASVSSTEDARHMTSATTTKTAANNSPTANTDAAIATSTDQGAKSSTEDSNLQTGVKLDVEEVLAKAKNAVELEVLGLDSLKAALQERGMKCGGTLTERAHRLFAVKGLTADQIDPSLLAKGKNKKSKK